MAALAGFGYNFAVHGLITPGDAARTAQQITAHEGLFGACIASLFLAAILDVVVAWALYRVFRPVSQRLSALAAWLRVVYAGVFAVAILRAGRSPPPARHLPPGTGCGPAARRGAR